MPVIASPLSRQFQCCVELPQLSEYFRHRMIEPTLVGQSFKWCTLIGRRRSSTAGIEYVSRQSNVTRRASVMTLVSSVPDWISRIISTRSCTRLFAIPVGGNVSDPLKARVLDPLFTTTATNRDLLGSGRGLGVALERRYAQAFHGHRRGPPDHKSPV